MKITNKILNRINESEETDGIIDFLIKDEQEAIDGYRKAINQFADIALNEEELNTVTEKLNHILEEEQEHIKELEQVKAFLNK